MTIQEKKQELELKLLDLIQKFEAVNDVRILMINPDEGFTKHGERTIAISVRLAR